MRDGTSAENAMQSISDVVNGEEICDTCGCHINPKAERRFNMYCILAGALLAGIVNYFHYFPSVKPQKINYNRENYELIKEFLDRQQGAGPKPAVGQENEL